MQDLITKAATLLGRFHYPSKIRRGDFRGEAWRILHGFPDPAVREGCCPRRRVPSRAVRGEPVVGARGGKAITRGWINQVFQTTFVQGAAGDRRGLGGGWTGSCRAEINPEVVNTSNCLGDWPRDLRVRTSSARRKLWLTKGLRGFRVWTPDMSG